MRFSLPNGVNDFLPEELKRKQALESGVRETFRLWGYDELLPAGVDFYDNYIADAGNSARPQEQLLKSFDAQGRIIIMRPEFTAALARLAATKLRELPLPLRLCYLGSAYQNPAADVGAQRSTEFTQAGVELMGLSGAQADAEAVLLALELMERSGLTHRMVELGQVEFFMGLMEETGLSPDAIDSLRLLVEQKNSLAVELLLRKEGVSAAASARIMELPMLFGGEEVLKKARRMSSHPRCVKALDDLEAILTILRECSVADTLSIDLGMVPALGYYTGMVFRGLTASLGQPILSGGRYDGLLKLFGRPMPATGFAMGIERTLLALQHQGYEGEAAKTDILLALRKSQFSALWPKIRAWRAQGKRVALCYEDDDAQIEAQARRINAETVLRAQEVL